MKYQIVIVMVLCSLCCLTQATDIRNSVHPGNEAQSVISEINPDEHIFGIKYGTTENEFITTYGKPDGYIRLDANTTAMIYGKSVAFIFQSEQLDGVRITHSVLDWQLSQEMLTTSVFDRIKWKLTNGIKEDTPRPKVKEILGDSLINEDYRWQYETDIAEVILNFSHYTSEGESESAYKVCGITIRKK